MPVNIPVGFGQAALRFSLAGTSREKLCTFGYDPPTTDPTVHAQAITDAFTAANRPGVSLQIQEGWSYLGVRVTEMTDTGPVTGEAADLVDGAMTGGALPPNAAVLIRKNTAAGGRRNRGRLFVPPIYPPETNVSPSGIIADTQLDNIQLWWTNFFTAVSVAGLEPVILHSSAPFTPTPITGWVAQDLIATQRRRMRR